MEVVTLSVLPVRTYRRDTTASEPLEQARGENSASASAIAIAGQKRSITPIPSARRRLNVPDTYTSAPAAARENCPLSSLDNNAVNGVRRPSTPLTPSPTSVRQTSKFAKVLSRIENDFGTEAPPRPPSSAPVIIPSYCSTHSLPISSSPRGSQTSRPPSIAEKQAQTTPFRLRAFSFETTPPVSSKVTNQDCLEETGSSQHDLAERRKDSDSSSELHHPQFRNTSSSYPSEGIRSPDLTVSPPLTFGRRILSSLSGYAFSRERLSFLQSDDDVATKDGSGQNTDSNKESTHDSQDLPLYQGQTTLSPEEATIAAAITLSRLPPEGDEEDYALPPPESPLSRAVSALEPNDNASTQCLPRASTTFSFPIYSQRPSLDQDPHNISFSYSLRERISGRFRRHCIHQSGDRVLGEHKPVRVVKVKKWFVRQFRAGRKGSRVIVKKVRRLSEEVKGSRYPKREDEKPRRVTTTSKSVRSRFLQAIGGGTHE
ncbi:hypothetical protein QBC35DRAFT_447775 [Podospora australis]|uniref:Uncharacterized protein n=1 Tax=Podospora australis TaxID=1536484 RepID=A0AAN6X1A4_9PEZI|nr:hypothetical protein QBC35DRAFT_447775 [Podospora australis]